LKKILVATYSDYVKSPNAFPLPDFVRTPREKNIPENAIHWRQALEARLAPRGHQAGPADLAAMPYTSGTTGKPKGCMHTHRNIQATACAYLQWRGAEEG